MEGSITVRVSREEEEFLRFEVIDTGIGIKEEDKANMFTMFSKVSNEASVRRNTRGVGLGLTICKRLVE